MITNLWNRAVRAPYSVEKGTTNLKIKIGFEKTTKQWYVMCHIHNREIAFFSAESKEEALLRFAKILAARLFEVETAMHQMQHKLPDIPVEVSE